jgi:hypothetical protein
MVRVAVVLLAGLAMGARAEGEEQFVVEEVAARCEQVRYPARRVMEALGFEVREADGWLTRFRHRRATENWRQVMARVGPVTVATMVLEDG